MFQHRQPPRHQPTFGPGQPAFIVAKWCREDEDFYQILKAFSRDEMFHITSTLEKVAPTSTVKVARSVSEALSQMKVCECNEGDPPTGFLTQIELENVMNGLGSGSY